jgi:hypothetical protein
MAWRKAESGDSMDGGTPPRTRAVSLALATSALRAVPIARLRRRATMAVIKLNLFILLLSLFGPRARPGSAAR